MRVEKNRADGFAQGVLDGLPICIGYIPAAMAFGLMCRNLNLLFFDALLFSLTNFAGASQFFAADLIASGAMVSEIAIGVLMMNCRYLFMGASMASRLDAGLPMIRKLLVGYGTTDEIFSVSTLKRGNLSASYLSGLQTTAWSGWFGGTALGFLVGMILPVGLQVSVGVTLYAMFAALLAQEVKNNYYAALVAGFSALVNSTLILGFGISTGWAFIVALIAGTLLGAFIIPDSRISQLNPLSCGPQGESAC